MTELLDIVSNVIPTSQKQVLRRFYQVRDNVKLTLYEHLETHGVLPIQLRERLLELKRINST